MKPGDLYSHGNNNLKKIQLPNFVGSSPLPSPFLRPELGMSEGGGWGGRCSGNLLEMLYPDSYCLYHNI